MTLPSITASVLRSTALILVLASIFATRTSAADELLTQKALNFLKQSPPCPSAPGPSTRSYRTIRASADKKTKILFDFRCKNGKKQEQFTVIDENLKVLFSSFIHNDNLKGAAQFIEHPGTMFVWVDGRLTEYEQLPKLSSDKKSIGLPILNGTYRNYYELTKTHVVVNFKNGVVSGERVFVSKFVPPPPRAARSPEEEHYQTIDQRISYRTQIDNFTDGLFQFGADSFFVTGKWNNLDRIPPEQKIRQQELAIKCADAPAVTLKDLLQNMEEAGNSSDDVSWLSETDSDQFRKQTLCPTASQNINRRSENGIVFLESSCYRPNFSGFVKIYDRTKGTLNKSVEYRDGKPHGLIAHGRDGVIDHQAIVQDGKVESVCSNVMNVKFLTDRKNELKKSAGRSGLFGFSGSLVSRNEYSAGIWYSPNFYTRDIGGGGFFVEAELRKRDQNYLGRLSAGPGGVVMAFNGYGTMGVGFDSKKIKTVDFTLGAGLLIASVFVRPVYQIEEKNVIGEAGIKVVLPF